MAEKDRKRWDEWYGGDELAMGSEPPEFIRDCRLCLPRSGRALDVACGEGQVVTWLARRGMSAVGLDISERALQKAARLSRETHVEQRVEFAAWDLEQGLPELDGEFDLITCLRYYQPSLMPALRARLAPGGLLLLEVRMVTPEKDGRFRADPGETLGFAGDLHVHLYREGRIGDRDGAQLLAQRPPVSRMVFESSPQPGAEASRD
ncbi:MAG: class I SAM-dependent methyltransferase [Gammaproteobacteria bacterium]